MTIRERILAVYRGETPDCVPYMLDLSHWFYHRFKKPWDLSKSYDKPEQELFDYHRKHDVGFYMPNLGSFFTVRYEGNVRATVERSDDGRTITWTYHTPLGSIRRQRIWEEESYSWGIRQWTINSEDPLRILAHALSHRRYAPQWERYRAWVEAVGDCGEVYLPMGYSAVGHLLSYWMGVENTMYAMVDWPETFAECLEQINRNNLDCIDLLCESPAEVVILGDNFSSDIQPPSFFKRFSAGFYAEAVRRLHQAGKYVAVHIDGLLRGSLGMIRDIGADAADAVTPTPLGDLTPQQCRDEAGESFILSGGVSPELWLPNVPLQRFQQAAHDWLALKQRSPRLIANAGDQVPPGAEEQRIGIMRDIVKEHGRY